MTEPVVLISALEHFVYCERQCALIHGDGVWMDNAHTVRGSHAHRRVDSGLHRRERGVLTLRSIPLWSETLGLSGRADTVEFNEGAVYPVEHKSGVRHGKAADLQVCAQAMCLEEMMHVDIPVAYVWYGGPRRRAKVLLDHQLRTDVIETVESVRAQLLSGELPAAPNDARCEECQLEPHCLPSATATATRIAALTSEALLL
ncbi:CRISPR-associated protein Cas4 [Candidatus Poriferisodalis sp.]|uniref:CRISPR-associated protein Cas4 n=1 Tax=Candidatus Poriferisodalis sp. TaxID=3101277 RepID=UPI003B016A12